MHCKALFLRTHVKCHLDECTMLRSAMLSRACPSFALHRTSHRCHICTGTGLTTPTSAPGPGRPQSERAKGISTLALSSNSLSDRTALQLACVPCNIYNDMQHSASPVRPMCALCCCYVAASCGALPALPRMNSSFPFAHQSPPPPPCACRHRSTRHALGKPAACSDCVCTQRCALPCRAVLRNKQTKRAGRNEWPHCRP